MSCLRTLVALLLRPTLYDTRELGIWIVFSFNLLYTLEVIMLQKSQEILGKTVVNSDGVVIGEVNDYLIHTKTWQVTDLLVKIEKKKAKELGLKTPFFGSLLVLVEVQKISSLTDQIILSLGADEFKSYVEQRKSATDEEDEPAEDDSES